MTSPPLVHKHLNTLFIVLQLKGQQQKRISFFKRDDHFPDVPISTVSL